MTTGAQLLTLEGFLTVRGQSSKFLAQLAQFWLRLASIRHFNWSERYFEAIMEADFGSQIWAKRTQVDTKMSNPAGRSFSQLVQ